MTPQRLAAAIVAAVATAVMLFLVAFTTLPYLAYSPGPTIDVLGEEDGRPIVQVSGAETYPTEGQLRLTTVSVSTCAEEDEPKGKSFGEVLQAWLSRSQAVYPYEVVCPDNETPEQSKQEGQVAMVSSQDTAKAVALRALGLEVTSGIEVLSVQTGSAADGALQVRDFFLAVDGKDVETGEEIAAAVKAAGTNRPVEFTLRREGEEIVVPVTPELVETVDEDGKPVEEPRIGVSTGPGYQFPFSVAVDIDPGIGGPSAGLMFSLAIYDTLTPGSLTGGGLVAGTGEIDAEGTVGEIGGIQQKIVGARREGAELFLVPAGNCDDAEGSRNGDMRLVRVATMESALDSLQAWAADRDADLPSCGTDS